MNTRAFAMAYRAFKKAIPYSDFNRYHAIRENLESATKPDHTGKYFSRGGGDYYRCACGWESPGFDDGVEFAWDVWLEHVAQVCGIVKSRV